MSKHSVKTPEGEIKLIEPDIEWARELRASLPMGMTRMQHKQTGEVVSGIVMKCGEREVWGEKFQTVDLPIRDARMIFECRRAASAGAIASHLGKGFKGITLPVAYFKQKGDDLAEAGLAVFAFPALEDAPTQKTEIDQVDVELGAGAVRMIFEFAGAHQEAWRQLELPELAVIGVDLRPRLELGHIALDFLMHGSRVYALGTTIDENDGVWGELARSGITEVLHLPTAPVEIAEEHLEQAFGRKKWNA